mgnify:CR=1 FL=1
MNDLKSNPNLSEYCYQWRGTDKSGLYTEGQIFASSRGMAKALLLQKGNTPNKIWRKSQPIISNLSIALPVGPHLKINHMKFIIKSVKEVMNE